MARKARRGPGRKGYSAAKKAEILAAAKKGNLTGETVAKGFGISALTFYHWRGSVRGRKKRGRLVGSKNRLGKEKVDTAAGVRKMLPQIIREEAGRALTK